MVDKTLLTTKYIDLYLSTLQIGIGIAYVPQHNNLHLHFIVFELVINFKSNT